MGRRESFVTAVGGRYAILGLGVLYLGSATALAYTEIARGEPISNSLVLAFFVAGPGMILLYGGNWLPRSDIHPKFHPTVTSWVLTAIIILSGMLTIYHLLPAASIDNPPRTILIITGFVIVPAFIGGIYSARAETRSFQLEQQNRELQQTRDQLKSRENSLELANQRLETSNERLEQFAYAASHDLQEPLRMVSSYLQLIERQYADELDDDGREYFEFAVDGADRMRAMISGLLEYSRVDSAGEPLKSVDLDKVLQDVCSDLSVRIAERDATVSIEDLPSVKGDEAQLRQVFQNLLSNAITYSGNNPPEVSISAEQNGSRWKLSVKDSGIGIAPQYQDRIFDIFYRLNSRNGEAGSGIGLALCERILERHGSNIWVNSEPGEGATFSFTLSAVEE